MGVDDDGRSFGLQEWARQAVNAVSFRSEVEIGAGLLIAGLAERIWTRAWTRAVDGKDGGYGSVVRAHSRELTGGGGALVPIGLGERGCGIRAR